MTSRNSEFLLACTTNAHIQRLCVGVIKSAKATVDSVAAMKDANMQLKKVKKKDMYVDAVDYMADDLVELTEDMNKVLGRNFMTPEIDI